MDQDHPVVTGDVRRRRADPAMLTNRLRGDLLSGSRVTRAEG